MIAPDWYRLGHDGAIAYLRAREWAENAATWAAFRRGLWLRCLSCATLVTILVTLAEYAK